MWVYCPGFEGVMESQKDAHTGFTLKRMSSTNSHNLHGLKQKSPDPHRSRAEVWSQGVSRAVLPHPGETAPVSVSAPEVAHNLGVPCLCLFSEWDAGHRNKAHPSPVRRDLVFTWLRLPRPRSTGVEGLKSNTPPIPMIFCRKTKTGKVLNRP